MRNYFIEVFKQTWFVCVYIISSWSISYIHELKLIAFPYDNLVVAIVSVLFLKVFIATKASTETIHKNIQGVMSEIENLKSS